MSQLIVLLDVGEVINDKRQQTTQFRRLVNDHFVLLLSGTSQEMYPLVQIDFERTPYP
jgi:hypothetical protein